MEKAVLDLLRADGPSTAIRITQKIPGAERSVVNRTLYRLEELNQTRKDATTLPPVWSIVVAHEVETTTTTAAGASPPPLAVVDLGNVHDTLKELVPYARAGAVDVEAFADRAFNGYGVKPSIDGIPNVRVHRAEGRDRNAADIELVWRMCEILPDATAHPELARTVVVATKDQGFQALKDLVRRRGHSLTFVTCWAEMRDIIE